MLAPGKPGIAFIAPEAWSAYAGKSGERTGGAETQQLLIAEGLKSRGWRVSLLVSTPRGEEGNLPDWVKSAYTRRDKRSLLGFLADSVGLFVTLAKTKAGVFVQRCSFHDAARVAFFARLLGAKFVFWVGAEYNVNEEWLRNNLSHLRRKAYIAAIRSADSIVCQTKSQASSLQASFNLTANIIANGVIVSETSNVFQGTQKHLLTAIWGGRVNDNKRPELLVELARKTVGWRFIVAALKERDNEEKYLSFINATREVQNLEILTDVSQERFFELTSKADLAINTSRMEGFPNTLLEAFARGVPALTLGVDPDGVITNNGIGWVCETVDCAAAEMKSLADEPGRLRDAGNRGRAYVIENHSEQKVLDELEEVLAELLDSHA